MQAEKLLSTGETLKEFTTRTIQTHMPDVMTGQELFVFIANITRAYGFSEEQIAALGTKLIVEAANIKQSHTKQ